MTCPHLEYRYESDDRSFDEPRAYCTVVDRFVQPMRADVCNDRYDLDHAEHCEYFLAESAGREGSGSSDGGNSDPYEANAGDSA